MIYLDYSANTPVSEDVLRCFCETEREFFGNPNSTHDAGKAARKRMDEITVSIAGLMGAAPEEIIYTSCASESNNMALKGIAALARSRRHAYYFHCAGAFFGGRVSDCAAGAGL